MLIDMFYIFIVCCDVLIKSSNMEIQQTIDLYANNLSVWFYQSVYFDVCCITIRPTGVISVISSFLFWVIAGTVSILGLVCYQFVSIPGLVCYQFVSIL